jgi:hypothetical protein
MVDGIRNKHLQWREEIVKGARAAAPAAAVAVLRPSHASRFSCRPHTDVHRTLPNEELFKSAEGRRQLERSVLPRTRTEPWTRLAHSLAGC